MISGQLILAFHDYQVEDPQEPVEDHLGQALRGDLCYTPQQGPLTPKYQSFL
jgi:hypothetical protein